MTYASIPVALILFSVITGVAGAQLHSQNSHGAKVLNSLAGFTVLFIFIYTVPYIVLAVKYWREKVSPFISEQPNAIDHSVHVRYSTNFFAKMISNFASDQGILQWNNATKLLTLRKDGDPNAAPVFQLPYAQIKRFSVEASFISANIFGKAYQFYPYDTAITATTASDLATYGEAKGAATLATMVLGKIKLDKAGVSELVIRLQQEGVRAAYTSISGSFEYGVDYSLGFLFIGMLVICLFVIK